MIAIRLTALFFPSKLLLYFFLELIMDKRTDQKDQTNLIEQVCNDIQELNQIPQELYQRYEVKRGLRDISGKGVLAGLTRISEIHSYVLSEGDLIPCEGKLYYRGYDIEDLVNGFSNDSRFGFEEVSYLLLFGKLPSKDEYTKFREILASYYTLPKDFLNATIMSSPSKDMMNSLAKSVLTLYTFDDLAEDTSIANVVTQSLKLIAQFPSMIVYAYHSFAFAHNNQSITIKAPKPEYSIAQNILHMLRTDDSFTEQEAKILDLALVLHAEHGGGNNSSFTTHVVTSSGTDTYSCVAAALASLKGPRHGGANIKVGRMFDDIKATVKNWTNEEDIRAYLYKILDKQAFDKSGLIYGIGHAVYSMSDPRALIFKSYVEKLAKDKGREEEYELFSLVERLAPKVIAEKRQMYKGVSANIDFYSGFVYKMLDLPEELFTPLFAASRIVGWSAHRLEELANNGKIIRPAYKAIEKHHTYETFLKR